MATEQSLMFTVVPRDGIVDGDAVVLSVVVSPRLRGGDRLGEFADWLDWTGRLAENGLTLTLQAGNHQSEHRIDTAALRPALWQKLFNETTPVRSHRYDDHAQRANQGVMSFSVRDSLSLIKQAYCRASIDLALPDNGDRRRNDLGPRGVLRGLLDGFAVHWDSDLASGRRRKYRTYADAGPVGGPALPLDAEGLYDTGVDGVGTALNARRSAITERFATFHHMPTPAYSDAKHGDAAGKKVSNLALDADHAVDFHQALSALGNYPALQRALGLVFDLRVPREQIEASTGAAPLFISVVAQSLQFAMPPVAGGVMRTAYYLLTLDGGHTLFHTAQRAGIGRGMLGLAWFDPQQFGLAQVDVDGAMHKTILLAESLAPRPSGGAPAFAAHPAVFDAGATLPALRSGGISVYIEARAARWIASLRQSQTLNSAFEASTAVDLYGEDLVRGLRLDVWDDAGMKWHSLHARRSVYFLGDVKPDAMKFDPVAEGFDPALEEGWMESAATRPAPGTEPADDQFYLHEALARWTGWSLSARRPDLPLHANPTDRTLEEDETADTPVTPFKLTVDHTVMPGSLPSLRFGRRYRVRARLVNLAGLSVAVDDPVAARLSDVFALPNGAQDGMAYRRFEPVPAPLIVVDNADAILMPGSTLQRIVIRTDNHSPDEDHDAAGIDAAARHLLPPRTSVELGERLGMFDDAAGKLRGDAATRALIGARDAGELPTVTRSVAGQDKTFPLIAGAPPADLPYLPDPLARGVALRNLPGAPGATLARVDAATPSGPVVFVPLDDVNPHLDSVLMIGFGGETDWQLEHGLKIMLAEPSKGTAQVPDWDAPACTLTVYLAKAKRCVVAASCYLAPADLPKMGIWQWLQEEIAARLQDNPRPPGLQTGGTSDETAQIVQRVVEGGHWMLTPPALLELVHAVRQPPGIPEFMALDTGFGGSLRWIEPVSRLQTALTTAPLQAGRDARARGRRDSDELAALTGWRTPGATDAFLIGALKVCGAATARVDLLAAWTDPVDDPAAPAPIDVAHQAAVDRIDLPTLEETYLRANDAAPPDIDSPYAARDDASLRAVGYYDPEHDQIAFVKKGDRALPSAARQLEFDRDAAPRHAIGDTRHHRIRYQAVTVSRDADCFDTPVPGEEGFARPGRSVEVSIPASSRPLAPDIAYVIPSFGWQRHTDTGVKRSVRYGGLRVYMRRPWFSSGPGELLGVSLWAADNPHTPTQAERDAMKPYFTQWGMDPIWQAASLGGVPGTANFPDRVADAANVSLDETTALRVDVAGYAAHYDAERQLWFADLNLNAYDTYAPFVRLALVRYQPEALPDVRISRVVLADFAQLTPDRAVLVLADPRQARTLRVQVSGVAPHGPQAIVYPANSSRPRSQRPSYFRVRVQEHVAELGLELGWQDIATESVAVRVVKELVPSAQSSLSLWEGEVQFAQQPAPGRYRLLIEEYEAISTDQPAGRDANSGLDRLVFAEIFALDASLAGGTPGHSD